MLCCDISVELGISDMLGLQKELGRFPYFSLVWNCLNSMGIICFLKVQRNLLIKQCELLALFGSGSSIIVLFSSIVPHFLSLVNFASLYFLTRLSISPSLKDIQHRDILNTQHPLVTIKSHQYLQFCHPSCCDAVFSVFPFLSLLLFPSVCIIYWTF